MNTKRPKNLTFYIVTLLILFTTGTVDAKFLFFGKKKAKTEKTEPTSKYKQLTSRDSVKMEGVMNAVKKGDSIYLELPVKLLGKPFLVNNKLQQVPVELGEASANKGINYESMMVRFEWNEDTRKVVVREQRVRPEVPAKAAIAASVADNYIDPVIATLPVSTIAPDSTTILFAVNDLFNGKKNILNDVFNEINIGTAPSAELSRIISVKAYEKSVVALSELTTTVHEGNSKVNVTVVVSTAIFLLPEDPMPTRREDWRVGFFSTPSLQYSDNQQRVKHLSYITRWRLIPSDTAKYMRGELTEPVKPIIIYLDKATPAHLKPYITKGITDWNPVFERAGFKNVVKVIECDDSTNIWGDDMRYSVLTYNASEKKNAMGPSTIDPRTGEILEADIVWWHNVQQLVNEWIRIQLPAIDKRARRIDLPEELIGDAVRLVACHEMGHSLGLRHNMIASAAYPTDSLRSETFLKRTGGLAASIMDYARFNYVAQPGDGVTTLSSNIGPYDYMAIEWGYRWYPYGTDERKALDDFLSRHKGKEYRFSEQQQQRSAIDPRALNEDLGDDAMKSARYGIANLKRIMPNLVEWTKGQDPSQNYDEAAELYSSVIWQWNQYLYHVLANIGGIYMERPMINWTQGGTSTTKAYTFVEKKRQREAVQFLIDEVLTFPKWLFGSELAAEIYPLNRTPMGAREQEPAMLLKNSQNYILWDMLDNERLIRMYENEWMNGDNAFTPVDMMDMLHRSLFAKTERGQKLDMMDRSVQKSFVDALMTAAAEQEGIKLNKKFADGDRSVAGSGSRRIEVTNSQISRNSDALSVKRAELLRILRLMKQRRNTGDLSTQMHYEDVMLRIQTALGIKN